MRDNRQVLIVGGGSPVAFQIAVDLCRDGAEVCLMGRREEQLKKNKTEIEAKSSGSPVRICEFDTSIPELQEENALIKRTEKLNFWPNAIVFVIGSGAGAVPLGLERSELQRIFDVNFFSIAFVMDEFKRHLKANESSVVFISSIASKTYVNAPIGYACAKAALNSLASCLAVEMAPNCRINTLLLGNLMHSNSVWSDKLINEKQQVNQMLKEKVPLGTFGNLRNVSKMVCHCISSDSKFMTGAEIVIDGGQSLL